MRAAVADFFAHYIAAVHILHMYGEHAWPWNVMLVWDLA